MHEPLAFSVGKICLRVKNWISPHLPFKWTLWFIHIKWNLCVYSCALKPFLEQWYVSKQPPSHRKTFRNVTKPNRKQGFSKHCHYSTMTCPVLPSHSPSLWRQLLRETCNELTFHHVLRMSRCSEIKSGGKLFDEMPLGASPLPPKKTNLGLSSNPKHYRSPGILIMARAGFKKC